MMAPSTTTRRPVTIFTLRTARTLNGLAVVNDAVPAVTTKELTA